MSDALLPALLEWLRIPSVSTGGGRPEDLRAAAEWVCERIRDAGGEAGLVEPPGDLGGNPIAYGELAAGRPGAPTVLIYGHYDVQGPGPPELWASPPFEPEVRDGRLHARGASDDKGNFLPLLQAACDLAREGALPVDVRVVVEGEEEIGSPWIMRWLAEDERGADAAIVFDSGMADERTPAITTGLRGMVLRTLRVTVARRDLHSGLYGGAALNALHVLHRMLAAVLPGPDGRLRDELRAGVEPPAEAERTSWSRLPDGAGLVAEAGGRLRDDRAGAEFYERTGAEPSLDVNRVTAGENRTIVPAVAEATVSLRLAPRQDAETMAAVLERLLREQAPEGVEVEMAGHMADPALFAVDGPVMQIAAGALERATGAQPAFVRSGGSIPIVAGLAAKGIATVVSGFSLPDDEIHAPNESFRLESLRLGERAGRELLTGLGALR